MTGLSPERQSGTFVFVSVDPATDLAALEPVATVREVEGLTLVLPIDQAVAGGFEVGLTMAWITLTLPTALDAVGITAAFAPALAAADIPCNVIAGACHDHLFVPESMAERAMAILAAVTFR